MRGRMKTITAAMLAFLVLYASGCQSARELRDLSIVTAIGIDKSEQCPGKLLVTAQIALPAQMQTGTQGIGQGLSSGSTKKPYFNLQYEGDTLMKALREMTRISNCKLYLAHNQVVVFGRRIAAEGVRPHLDFLSKETESRPETKIVIADRTAAEVLDAGATFEPIPSMNLNTLLEMQRYNAQSMPVTMQEFSKALLSETAAPVAPIVAAELIGNENVHKVMGMGVFRSDFLSGQLSEEEGKGLLFLTGRYEYGVDLVSYQGQTLALEIIHARSELKPEVRGDAIGFTLKIDVESNLMEQSGTAALNTNEDLHRIETAQRELFRSQIGAAFARAKSLGADLFGLGELLKKYCPGEWETIRQHWDERFAAVQLKTEINNLIRGTGIKSKPLAPEKENE